MNFPTSYPVHWPSTYATAIATTNECPYMTTRTDHRCIIAIDPDVERSGVAVLDTSARTIKAMTMTFPELMEYLSSQQGRGGTLVVVEAGWLNKAHWHLTARDTARQAAAKGNSTGRNHETARKIVEMSRHYGLDTIEARPLRKCWQGQDGKITHGELALQLSRRGIAGLGKTSCQDARDAAWLAVVHSNL